MTFEAVLLPYDTKDALCRSLLAEFGADRVRKSGDELLHRCVMPWHDDRNPSARLNVEKLTYKCWSCDSGGGLLWLIAAVRGGSRHDAFEWVSGTTGLDGEDLEAFTELLEAMAEDRSVFRPPMPSYSRKVLDPWAFTHPWLTDPRSEGGRGIPEANVEALEIGYAEAYPLDDKGRTSERIIIPHFWRGRLVGWQSRRLDDTDGTPKYLSTEDFPKDETIFHAPEDKSLVVVVEAPMSVARHVHHLPVAATFGASVTDYQVRLLAEYERVVLFPDPDTAGWRWITGGLDEEGEHKPGLAERLEPYTDVEVVESDWAVDPADMDEAVVAELVDQAVPAALWDKPERLRCWDCKEYHSGYCREED